MYYGIAIPLVTLYIKAFNRTKFVNRKAVRKIRGGFVLYGNHSHWSDAFLPHVVAAMKRAHIIASPDAVSVKGIKNIVLMLGTIPLPTKPEALRPFYKAVRQRCREGGCIGIYPEAHIWPYYTGVRPFSAASFAYPAEFHVPVVAMATIYRERKGRHGFRQEARAHRDIERPDLCRTGYVRPRSPALFPSARDGVSGSTNQPTG